MLFVTFLPVTGHVMVSFLSIFHFKIPDANKSESFNTKEDKVYLN